MMMPKRPDGLIRAFGMSGLQITTNLRNIELERDLELGHEKVAPTNRKSSDYEQFELKLRQEASRMSEFYEVFYCLENSIRQLVACLLYTSPSPRDGLLSRMPSSA